MLFNILLLRFVSQGSIKVIWGHKGSINFQLASSDSTSSSYPCKIRQSSWSSFCSKYSDNWWTSCHDLFPKLVCELGLGHFDTSQCFLYAWIRYFISFNRFDIHHSRMGLPQIRSHSRRRIISRLVSKGDIIIGTTPEVDRIQTPDATVEPDLIHCRNKHYLLTVNKIQIKTPWNHSSSSGPEDRPRTTRLVLRSPARGSVYRFWSPGNNLFQVNKCYK